MQGVCNGIVKFFENCNGVATELLNSYSKIATFSNRIFRCNPVANTFSNGAPLAHVFVCYGADACWKEIILEVMEKVFSKRLGREEENLGVGRRETFYYTKKAFTRECLMTSWIVIANEHSYPYL